MKKNKKKKVIIIFVIIIALASLFLGALYYITSTVNNYSYSEKRWIADNSSTTMDVYIEPDLPVFSSNGSGVFYDYVTALKEDTGLNINVITDNSSKTKFINKNSITDRIQFFIEIILQYQEKMILMYLMI